MCYCLFQSESAEEKERELSQELSRIQHEVGECPETSKKKTATGWRLPKRLRLV